MSDRAKTPDFSFLKLAFTQKSDHSPYHNLGSVAQELREYEQARTHYQQALDIYIEFNDRYEQAGTYHNLAWIIHEG